MSPKKLVCLAAAVLPFAAARIWAYRLFCRYRIGGGTRIGFCTVINARTVTIGQRVKIGAFNRVLEVGEVAIRDDVTVGPFNLFGGMQRLEIGKRTNVGSHLVSIAPRWKSPAGSLIVGADCVITGRHHFDICDNITIGEAVTIAGVFSALWTHGWRKEKSGPINIGDGCYLGSGVQVAPKVTLPAKTVVGMGAVVTRSPTAQGQTLIGVPAKPMRATTEEA